MFDLAVIGAGPAGAAAAWMAARAGRRVVLLERGQGSRDKVCGEFFSGEGLALLEAMAPRLLDTAPRIGQAAFVAASGRSRGFELPRAGIGVSRLALDAALARSAMAAGAEWRPGWGVAQANCNDAGWWLRTADGREARAQRLIVATGRSTNIVSSAKPARLGAWLGVKARFRGLAIGPTVVMFPFRGGYCGLAPVEGGLVNACCLVERRHAGDLRRSRDFRAWLRGSGAPGALLRTLEPAGQTSPTVVTAPVALGRRAAVGPMGELNVGDASGFLDPFTGDGMARAMLSGALAAQWLDDSAGYARALALAAAPAHRLAGSLRLLVTAPTAVQSAALRLLAWPRPGRWLFSATRWRTLSSAGPGRSPAPPPNRG